MKNVKKSRGYSPALLQHLIDFPFDVPYAPVHGRLGHIELALYLDDGVCPDAQVEHGPLLIGEIALPAEAVTFRLGELSFDVHRFFTLTLLPFDFPLPFLRTRATIRAIEDTARVITLDKIRVSAVAAVHNVGVELTPLVDVVDVRPGKRCNQHTDDDNAVNQQLSQKQVRFLEVCVHFRGKRGIVLLVHA